MGLRSFKAGTATSNYTIFSNDGWSELDGRNGAPTGTPQLSNILSGYNPARIPPWSVAGVAYKVGIDRTAYPTDGNLTSYTTFSQAGYTRSSTHVTISQSGTFDGIDFSGAYVDITANALTVVFTNCKWDSIPGGQTYALHVQQTACNLTLRYCEWSTSEDWVGFQAGGTFTMEYCYIHLGGQHPFEQVSGVVAAIIRFNLFHNNVIIAGAHNNWMQWGTIGAGSTAVFEFNCSYHDTIDQANIVPGEGPQYYANNSGTLTSATCKNNTFIAVLDGSDPTMSNIVHGASVGAGTNTQNYFDTSGCSGGALPAGAYYGGSVTVANGWTSSGNIDMLTGNTITLT